MKTVTCHLKSASPYSHRKPAQPEYLPGELHMDRERRTWREYIHRTEEGHVFIPPSAFTKSLQDAAQYLSIKIPGERNATWTKHFISGVMVREPLVLPDTAGDVRGAWLFVPADGRRGSGKRVWRCFMELPSWEGDVTYDIADPKIEPDIFSRVLHAAGVLIGIGYFRPQNRGYWGRYTPTSITWSELDI